MIRVAAVVAVLLLLLAPFGVMATEPAKKSGETLPDGAVARFGSTRMRHPKQPYTIAFAPNGKTFASGGTDGTIRIWDARTGEQLRSVRFGDSDVPCLQFSRDGQHLTVQCADEKVRILDAETLKPIRALPMSSPDSVSLSPDGKLVLGVNLSDKITLLEVENGLPRMEIPDGKAAAFLPDGSAIAAADSGETVTILEIPGGKPRRKFQHPTRTGVCCITVSPDGKWLATADRGKEPRVRLWNLRTGEAVADWEGIAPVHFVGNDRIASREGSGTTIRTTAEGKVLHKVPVEPEVFAVSPDCKRLVAGDSGPRMSFWDIEKGVEELAPGEGIGGVRGFATDRSAGWIYIGTGDTISRWSATEKSASPVARVGIPVVAIAAGGGRLATCTSDGIGIWDAPKPGETPPGPTRSVSGFSGVVRILEMSETGSHLVVATDAPGIAVVDPATGKILRSWSSPAVVIAIAIDPSGEHVAAVCRDGYVRTWDLKKGDPSEATPGWKMRSARTPRAGIAFSPDGRSIIASSLTRVSVYDASTGKQTTAFDRGWEDGPFQDVTVSPDGRLVATGNMGNAGPIVVWEIATRTPVRRFTTALGTISAVGFLDGGRRLASLGADHNLHIWDLTRREGKKEPTSQDLTEAWGKLDQLEAKLGDPAIWTLIDGGKTALPVIREGVTNSGATDAKIAKLITSLDADDPKLRDDSSKELLNLGVRAFEAISTAAENHASSEVRLQAGEILERFRKLGVTVPSNGLYGEPLRQLRAVAVLEKIGTPEAVEILRLIRKSAGPAGLAAEAALARKQPQKSE